MANELKTVDTQSAQLAVKTNNALTAFMTSSDSWKLFMSKFPAQKQQAISYDVYAYVNKHADTACKMQPNEFMARVVDAYSQGYTLQEGDAYILPFRDNKTGEQVATLVPGYKGIVRLAMQTGLFKHFDVTPVIRESISKFDYRRGVPLFNENYIPNGTEKTIGYYGYSETHTGMIREIYHPNEYFVDFAHRKSPINKGKDYLVGPWKDDFNAMCLKTMYKELGKLAPKVANPTEQQEQFFSMVSADDEPQYDRPANVDADGVVVEPSAIEEVDGETLPFDEPPIPDDYDYEPEPPQDYSQSQNDSGLKCAKCGKAIQNNVHEYSTKKYGKPLCYNCQQKHKA